MTLAQGIDVLEAKHQTRLAMIEFEDGSLYKFNYRLVGESENKFISLKDDAFFIQYQKAAQIIGKW